MAENTVEMNKILEEIKKMRVNEKTHLIDPEPHHLVTSQVGGIVPSWVAPTLYTNGLRYKGLGQSDTNRYTLATMAFGKYIGWGTNFKDFPTEFSDYINNLSLITIEGYGPIVDYPNSNNNFGGDEITDPGIYRKITIQDIASGNLIYKYMGQTYSGSNNYGWISSNHWENATIVNGIGTGKIKVRRSYDGASMDLDIRGSVDGMKLTSSSNITKIATLPDGYNLKSNGSSNNVYFVGFGQNTSAAEIFPVNMYINNNGKDIQLVANRTISRVIFTIKLNASDPLY